MTKKSKTAIAGGLILTSIAQAVLAQTVPAPDVSEKLNTVVITANKREERLQDVPAAATVVQSQQLDQQRITDVTSLTKAVPTLDASAAGLSVRGFGGGSFTQSAESSVAILIDGISLSSAGDNPPYLFDVERVEVLEGPQGTLFGKNATAGAINIVTKAPNTRKFEGQVQVDMDGRKGKSAQVALNLPLSDTTALRFAGSVGNDPQIIHNLPDDSTEALKKTSARLRFLWKATPDITVNLSADQSFGVTQGGAPWTVYKSTPGSALSSLLATCGVKVSSENSDACVGQSTKDSKTTAGGYSAQLDWSIGDYTLTSVSAVRYGKLDQPLNDLDSVNLPAPNYEQPQVAKRDNFSQEIRIASPEYAWGNFVAGVYSFSGKSSQDITALYSDPGFILGFPAKFGAHSLITADNNSSAVFGQGTYKISKDFAVTLGARAGQEEVSANRAGSVAAGAIAPLQPDSVIPVTGKNSQDYVAWRVGAQYDFSRDNMGYVTYAKGYKGAAVNDNATNPSIPLIVRPEVPTTLEIGSKNLFLNGRFGLNFAAYHTDIKDFQSMVFDPTALAFVFSNAPTATTSGVNINFYGKPVEALMVNGGISTMDSKYGSGYLRQCKMGSAPNCTRDGTGEQIGGLPKLRATLAAQYQFSLGGMRASLGGDVVYTSEKVFNPTDPDITLPAVAIYGARFGLRSSNDSWGVSLYARNLFDTFNPTYRIGNLIAFATGDNGSYTQFLGIESRRLVGVTFDVKF